MAQAKAERDAIPEGHRAVSFAFLKGGTTKTTLAVNTARHLADQVGDGEVLFIDLDTNGHATNNYDYGNGRGALWDSGTLLDEVLLAETDEEARDPRDLVYETQFGYDIIPSSDAHNVLESELKEEPGGFKLLRWRVVEPLLKNDYQYVIIDHPSDTGVMNNVGIAGSTNLIVPLLPAGETMAAWRRSHQQLVKRPQNRRLADSVDILAVTPNRLGKRIDQRTDDRKLLEAINKEEMFSGLIPSYARITEEEWRQIDAGEIDPPKPGIRESSRITQGMQAGLPLLDYAPEDPQNENFAELAEIVQNGGV